jgi:hypothetical protein
MKKSLSFQVPVMVAAIFLQGCKKTESASTGTENEEVIVVATAGGQGPFPLWMMTEL